MSAEKREVYRVPTEFRGLTTTIGEERNCRLQDVSATGFGVIVRRDIKLGEVVKATLYYEGHAFTGRASVQSVTKIEDQRKRCGFYCLDKQVSPASLPRGLHLISMGIQREHLRIAHAKRSAR